MITRINVATGEQVIVAGGLNSTQIAQLTAAVFGRENREGALYVTTAGDIAVPVHRYERVGGQLLEIETEAEAGGRQGRRGT